MNWNCTADLETSTRLAPCSASAKAHASPMPIEAPVWLRRSILRASKSGRLKIGPQYQKRDLSLQGHDDDSFCDGAGLDSSKTPQLFQKRAQTLLN